LRAGREARDLAGLRAAAVIHISTAPLVHSWTGTDQRVYPNYPQTCTQGVILAGRGATGEYEPRETASDLTLSLLPGGREVTFIRSPASTGRSRPGVRSTRPGPYVGPTLGGTPTCPVWQLPSSLRYRKRNLNSFRSVPAWRWPNHRRPSSATGSGRCRQPSALCGIALPPGLLIPDGGQACADIRWYCKDAR
jgi:hypothetical protein